VKRLILVAIFLEIGLLLIIIPWWSALWDQNYFARTLPFVHSVIANNYVRGAISGLGLVNIYVGLAELVSVLSARQSSPPSPLGTSFRHGE
jgi:hypothetical protein